MTLAMIGMLTLTATGVLLFRRAVEERQVRWRLNALQDSLRDLGYRDRALLRSDIFWTLDRSITAYCAMDTRVLLEVLCPVFTVNRQKRLEMERRQQALDEQLALPQHAEVAKLYEEAAGLVLRHLLLRHLFLSMMAAVTLVGLFGLWSCGRWISRRIVSEPAASVQAVITLRSGADGRPLSPEATEGAVHEAVERARSRTALEARKVNVFKNLQSFAVEADPEFVRSLIEDDAVASASLNKS